MVYGERDYWPDGSFVTTEWFVVAWVPIIPIGSKRISYTRNSDYATYDAANRCYVYESMGANRKQAAFVYLWVASVVAPLTLWDLYQGALGKILGSDDLAAGIALAITAIVLVTPYLLRRWVKRRKAAEWKRQSLGLHG